MAALTALGMRLADVSASPCATCLPGSPALQQIINGVMDFAEGGPLLARDRSGLLGARQARRQLPGH
jgi:hypothetical protein